MAARNEDAKAPIFVKSAIFLSEKTGQIRKDFPQTLLPESIGEVHLNG